MRANTRFPNRPELVQEHNPDTTLRVYEHAEANRAYARKEITDDSLNAVHLDVVLSRVGTFPGKGKGWSLC